jgi:hypothetical protein
MSDRISQESETERVNLLLIRRLEEEVSNWPAKQANETERNYVMIDLLVAILACFTCISNECIAIPAGFTWSLSTNRFRHLT